MVARRQADRVHPPAGPAVRPAGAAGHRRHRQSAGAGVQPGAGGRAAGRAGQRQAGGGQAAAGKRAAATAARRARRSSASPGLYSSRRFPAATALAFCVADVATGEASEFWHPAADDVTLGGGQLDQWAGDVGALHRRAGRVAARVYAVKLGADPATGRRRPSPSRRTTASSRASAFTSLSADGRTLFYCNNLGDIERRHVWKVPTSGGDAGAADDGRRDRDLPGAARVGQAGGDAQRRRPAAAVDRARVPAAGGRPDDRLPDAAEGVPARPARRPRERR